MINVSTRKVGGLRFVKIGRLTMMFCVSRQYRPLGERTRRPVPRPMLLLPDYSGR
jgi:hypothetical protein